MNAKKFSDAMSELDNKYIDEALNYKKKVKKPIWIKWGAMVASLLLVFSYGSLPMSCYSRCICTSPIHWK